MKSLLSDIGLFAFVAVVLAACQSVPKPAVIRAPIKVIERQYVKVRPELTQLCEIAEPRNRGGRELLRVARARKEALIRCANAQLGEIARIQGTAVESTP